VRRLESGGYANLLTREHADLDLTQQVATEAFFAQEKPDYVVLAAAKVGGIEANNSYRADFIYQNMMIAANIVHASWRHKTKKLLFLGSSCIYPKHAPQPMTEEYLLTGPLEPTNEPYAVAKIAGLKLCESFNRQYGTNFMSVMPTNIYGIGDNFDLKSSHVLPALLRKCHEAKARGDATFNVWGSGEARREFLYADDLADACVFLLERYNAGDLGTHINIGTGEDIPIRQLAEEIIDVVGFSGKLTWDHSKPDGMPRKWLDVSRIQDLGWSAKIDLRTGLEQAYAWYQSEHPSALKTQ
jgi:GDP-L-fucose synthase